jgi:hypothetical protein
MATIFLVGSISGLICFWLGFGMACLFRSAKESDQYYDNLEDDLRRLSKKKGVNCHGNTKEEWKF